MKIHKLTVEVRMLRNWARLMKLEPPSPPATPPVTPPPQSTNRENDSIDSNYEYRMDEEQEADELHKREENGMKDDKANGIDGNETWNISGTFVDSLEIGVALKRKRFIFLFGDFIEFLDFVHISYFRGTNISE